MDGRPPGLFIYYRQEDFSGLDIEQLFKHLTCVEHRIWSRRNSIADGYAIDSRGENLLHIVEGYSADATTGSSTPARFTSSTIAASSSGTDICRLA